MLGRDGSPNQRLPEHDGNYVGTPADWEKIPPRQALFAYGCAEQFLVVSDCDYNWLRDYTFVGVVMRAHAVLSCFSVGFVEKDVCVCAIF